MAATSRGKISPELRHKLRHIPADERINVVVRFEPPHIPESGSRAERINVTKRTFEDNLAAFIGDVAPSGGEVLDSAWINSTALVRGTPGQIKDLESQPQVEEINWPAPLKPE